MSVHEDPDNLGYWLDVDPPEFNFPAQKPSAELCEAIVPDWPCIVEAAICAHQNLHAEAAAARERGGYL